MKSIQITAIILAAFGVAVSTSCSTTKGFGQDLQKVGNRLENQADATGGAVPDAPAAPAAPSNVSAY